MSKHRTRDSERVLTEDDYMYMVEGGVIKQVRIKQRPDGCFAMLGKIVVGVVIAIGVAVEAWVYLTPDATLGADDNAASMVATCVNPQLTGLDGAVPIYSLDADQLQRVTAWEVGTRLTLITERTLEKSRYVFVQKYNSVEGGWVSAAVIDCADQPEDFITAASVCRGTYQTGAKTCDLSTVGSADGYWLLASMARVYDGDVITIVVANPQGQVRRAMRRVWQTPPNGVTAWEILTSSEIDVAGQWWARVTVNDVFVGNVPFTVP